MLKCTGVLQPEQTLHTPRSDGMELWEMWKEQEQRNRYDPVITPWTRLANNFQTCVCVGLRRS